MATHKVTVMRFGLSTLCIHLPDEVVARLEVVDGDEVLLHFLETGGAAEFILCKMPPTTK